jgi:hypothetical protein
MNCIFPPELEDKKLLVYLDGEVDQGTKIHLEQCQYCFEKAKDLARVHNLLTAHLYRITCPTSLELGEYYLRMLSAPQMLVVAQHLHECPHCTHEVNALENYLNDLTPVGESGVLEGIKTLVARWVGGNPESSLSPEPSALRGEAKGPLTFEADGIVIILDIQPASEGRVSVLGQVAADDQDRWTGAIVELRQVDAPPIHASLDDLGAFRFEEAHLGSTEITITSTDGIIVQTPNFDIAF